MGAKRRRSSCNSLNWHPLSACHLSLHEWPLDLTSELPKVPKHPLWKAAIFGSHGFIPDILSIYISPSQHPESNSPINTEGVFLQNCTSPRYIFLAKLISTSLSREKTTRKWGTYAWLLWEYIAPFFFFQQPITRNCIWTYFLKISSITESVECCRLV